MTYCWGIDLHTNDSVVVVIDGAGPWFSSGGWAMTLA